MEHGANTNPPPPWNRPLPPAPVNTPKGPAELNASTLPDGFPPELAYRALAAYSLLRTLSWQLRLSPFTPNVFLRALALPYPNRLLGQIHVCLLRILFPNLNMGYSYRPRGGHHGVSKRRRTEERDGIRVSTIPLRAGDNLTYLDGLSWPLFYDDYVQLMADILWNAMNDTQLTVDFRTSALRTHTVDVKEEDSEDENNVAKQPLGNAKQGRFDAMFSRVEHAEELATQSSGFPSNATSHLRGRAGSRGRGALPTRKNRFLNSATSPRRPSRKHMVDSDSENDSSDFDEQASDYEDVVDDDDDDEDYSINARGAKRKRKNPKAAKPKDISGQRYGAHAKSETAAKKQMVTSAGSCVLEVSSADSTGAITSLRVPIGSTAAHLKRGHPGQYVQQRPSSDAALVPVSNVLEPPVKRAKMTVPQIPAPSTISSGVVMSFPGNVGSLVPTNHPPSAPLHPLGQHRLESSQPNATTSSLSARPPVPSAPTSSRSDNNVTAGSVPVDHSAAAVGKHGQHKQPPTTTVPNPLSMVGNARFHTHHPMHLNRPRPKTTFVPAQAAQHTTMPKSASVPEHEEKPAPVLHSQMPWTQPQVPFPNVPLSNPRFIPGTIRQLSSRKTVLKQFVPTIKPHDVSPQVADAVQNFLVGNAKVPNTHSEPMTDPSREVQGEMTLLGKTLQGEQAKRNPSAMAGTSASECRSDGKEIASGDAIQASCKNGMETASSGQKEEPQNPATNSLADGKKSADVTCGGLKTKDSSGNVREPKPAEALRPPREFAAAAADEPVDESNDSDAWPHFEPVERMRRGVPYHRLPVEQKLHVLEFLLDELLTVDFIAAEFTRRNVVTSCYSFPYGVLPSRSEMESLENVDECVVCGLEGELLCCDGCTASYHRQCVNVAIGAALPEGRWLCCDCRLVDPAKFGPLRGEKKSALDWFTLNDLNDAARLKALLGESAPHLSSSQSLGTCQGFENAGKSNAMTPGGGSTETTSEKGRLVLATRQPSETTVAGSVIAQANGVTQNRPLSDAIATNFSDRAEAMVLETANGSLKPKGGLEESTKTFQCESRSSAPTTGDFHEYLIIHGFVFSRRRDFDGIGRDSGPCDMIEARAGGELARLKKGVPCILPMTKVDISTLLSRIGPVGWSWPFAQIPLNPQSFRASRSVTGHTVSCEHYFALSESYDPSLYLSQYRMAPLPGAKKRCVGSQLKHLVHSEYETECARPYTHKLSSVISRNMSKDSSLARDLRLGTSIYSPYQLFSSYMIKLEKTLDRACLLHEMWGTKSSDLTQNIWSENVARCRSVHRLALLLVRLIDAVHSRAFCEDWHRHPGQSSGKGHVESDSRIYLPLPSDWTPVDEIKKRKWEGSSFSNIRALLLAESYRFEGALEEAKSIPNTSGSRKRKQGASALRKSAASLSASEAKPQVDRPAAQSLSDTKDTTNQSIVGGNKSTPEATTCEGAPNQLPRVEEGVKSTPDYATVRPCEEPFAAIGNLDERISPSRQQAAVSLSASDAKSKVDRPTTHASTSTKDPAYRSIDRGNKSASDATSGNEPPDQLLMDTEEGVKPTPDHAAVRPYEDTLAASDNLDAHISSSKQQKASTESFETGRSPLLSHATSALGSSLLHGDTDIDERCGQQNLSSKGPENRAAVDAAVMVTDDKTHKAQTTGASDGSVQRKRLKKKASKIQKPRRSRRSRRLQHKNDVHDEIVGSLVTGSADVSTKDGNRGTRSNTGMEASIAAERRSKISQLEELIRAPFENELLWPVAGRSLFEPVGCLSPREMKRLARNAGRVVAPYLTYNSAFEVGQSAVCHIWRKKCLECRSFEELLMQIRVLDSYLDKSTINTCESLARRTSTSKSHVQKVVRCSLRDAETGVAHYFVVNKGKFRGCWVSDESIDLSALVLELSNRRDVHMKQLTERMQMKSREDLRRHSANRSNEKSCRQVQQCSVPSGVSSGNTDQQMNQAASFARGAVSGAPKAYMPETISANRRLQEVAKLAVQRRARLQEQQRRAEAAAVSTLQARKMMKGVPKVTGNIPQLPNSNPRRFIDPKLSAGSSFTQRHALGANVDGYPFAMREQSQRTPQSIAAVRGANPLQSWPQYPNSQHGGTVSQLMQYPTPASLNQLLPSEDPIAAGQNYFPGQSDFLLSKQGYGLNGNSPLQAQLQAAVPPGTGGYYSSRGIAGKSFPQSILASAAGITNMMDPTSVQPSSMWANQRMNGSVLPPGIPSQVAPLSYGINSYDQLNGGDTFMGMNPMMPDQYMVDRKQQQRQHLLDRNGNVMSNSLSPFANGTPLNLGNPYSPAPSPQDDSMAAYANMDFEPRSLEEMQRNRSGYR